MNPLSAGWRDAFGNTFGQLVRAAISQIISSEPWPWRYNAELYPPLVIREALRQLERVDPPLPATPEDLVSFELRFLIEVIDGSSHPIARENARQSIQIIQVVEARHPGKLAKIEAAAPGTLAKAGLGRRAAAA